jgi:hypothetical protein
MSDARTDLRGNVPSLGLPSRDSQIPCAVQGWHHFSKEERFVDSLMQSMKDQHQMPR